ncbi:MAG TPA: hypothetical protein VHK24_03415 [Steroidobacter sp.]|nr:hypothetical protein [Steroidobacter sp.]
MLFLLSVLCGYAAADEQASVSAQLVAEVRETARTPEGREHHRFLPAAMLTQGQVVYYTVRIHNPTPVYINDVAVTQRVPANTTYVPHSAAGPGAEVLLSTDGGQTFQPEANRTANAPRGAQSEDPARYTHILWKLRYPLAPDALALARFRAVFN